MHRRSVVGLALLAGPRLDDGRYLLLAGTDDDYSVTRNASGAQLDVWFDFTAAVLYASSIQCPIGQTTALTGAGLALAACAARWRERRG